MVSSRRFPLKIHHFSQPQYIAQYVAVALLRSPLQTIVIEIRSIGELNGVKNYTTLSPFSCLTTFLLSGCRLEPHYEQEDVLEWCCEQISSLFIFFLSSLHDFNDLGRGPVNDNGGMTFFHCCFRTIFLSKLHYISNGYVGLLLYQTGYRLFAFGLLFDSVGKSFSDVIGLGKVICFVV